YGQSGQYFLKPWATGSQQSENPSNELIRTVTSGITIVSFVADQGSSGRNGAAFALGVVDLNQRAAKIAGVPPLGVVGLELGDVGDPPDVVAGAVLVRVAHLHLVAADLLTQPDRLPHRAVGEPPAAHVVDLARPGVAAVVLERLNQVVGMDV